MEENYDMNEITTNKFLSRKNYIYTLSLWLMINSMRVVSTHPISQIISVLFGVWGIIIIIYYLGVKPELLFQQGSGYGFLFIIAVVLSFIGNRFVSPVKNIYTIIAVSINILLIYSVSNEFTKNDYIFLSKLITVGTFLLTIISLLMLYFRVSIPLGTMDDVLNLKFLGYDSLRGRFTGLSANANGLSRVNLCGLVSVATLYYFKRPEKNSKKLVYVAATAIFVVSIMLTESRGAILGMGIGVLLAVIVAVFYKNINKNQYIRILSVILVFILGLLLNYGLLDVSHKFVDVFPKSVFILDSNTGKENTNSEKEKNNIIKAPSSNNDALKSRQDQDEAIKEDVTNGRKTLMKNGILATLNKNPIFGLTYGKALDSVQNYITVNSIVLPNHLYISAGSMHNTFIQSFVYYGLIGFSTLTIFIFYLIHMYFMNFSFERRNVQDRDKMILISFILGIIVVLNMVEWIFFFDFDNHLINLLMLVCFSNISNNKISNMNAITLDYRLRTFLIELTNNAMKLLGRRK
uniref:O-antigen ligase-related domain-containing protein n=1 Tax=Erysipelothrix rhusiopathiae TaxID=1648 RepID=A0A5A4PYX8_ERYRH|nr:hypothetical protein [Erysipelothrix rhusiopathiae]